MPFDSEDDWNVEHPRALHQVQTWRTAAKRATLLYTHLHLKPFFFFFILEAHPVVYKAPTWTIKPAALWRVDRKGLVELNVLGLVKLQTCVATSATKYCVTIVKTTRYYINYWGTSKRLIFQKKNPKQRNTWYGSNSRNLTCITAQKLRLKNSSH